MRSLRELPAARLTAVATVVLALGACGSDDEPAPITDAEPVVTEPAPSTTTTPAPPVTQQTEPPEPSPRKLDVPEPDLLGEGDTQAVDKANEQIATVCDKVAQGDEPTETEVRDLATALSDLGKLVRANPDGIFRPPSRPENERTVRAVAEEAVEALRAGECLPDFADRLEQQIG